MSSTWPTDLHSPLIGPCFLPTTLRKTSDMPPVSAGEDGVCDGIVEGPQPQDRHSTGPRPRAARDTDLASPRASAGLGRGDVPAELDGAAECTLVVLRLVFEL